MGGIAACCGCLCVLIGEYYQYHQTTNNAFRYWPWNGSQHCYPCDGMAICFWRSPGSSKSWIDFSPTPPKFSVSRNHSRKSESNHGEFLTNKKIN